MRTIHMMRIAAALVVLTGCIFIIANGGIVTAVSIFTIGAVLAVWLAVERKRVSVQLAKLRQEKEQELLKALSHYRHDWMNDLQVLFGYISLKKYDKLAPYLEKIKSKLGEESHIANLGNTSLSLLLMSYRLYSQHFELRVTLDKSVNLSLLPIRPERLVRCVRFGLQAFHNAAATSEEQNLLELTIVSTDDDVQLIYHYSGQYDPEIRQSLEHGMQSEEGVTSEYTLDDEQIDYMVRIGYE